MRSPTERNPEHARRDTRSDWQRFRDIVVDALWDHERIAASFGLRGPGLNEFRGYVDEDAFVGTCPVCAGPISVRFAGRAPRADLACYGPAGGCSEAEVIAHIPGLRTRP